MKLGFLEWPSTTGVRVLLSPQDPSHLLAVHHFWYSLEIYKLMAHNTLLQMRIPSNSQLRPPLGFEQDLVRLWHLDCTISAFSGIMEIVIFLEFNMNPTNFAIWVGVMTDLVSWIVKRSALSKATVSATTWDSCCGVSAISNKTICWSIPPLDGTLDAE